MKVWKTIIEEDKYLETTLNKLEKDGAHIKEVIPYFFNQYGISSYSAREYKIIYTEENVNE